METFFLFFAPAMLALGIYLIFRSLVDRSGSKAWLSIVCLVLAIASYIAGATPSPQSSLKPSAKLTPKTEQVVGAEKQAKLEEAIRKSVENLRWSGARNQYGTLSTSSFATDEFKQEIETKMLELLRPLPASQTEANLTGYQFLAVVRPDNTEYSNKIQQYEEAIKVARQRVVAKLRKNEDRVEGITWYQHTNQPKYANSRSTAYLYIGKKGAAGRPRLRMHVQYAASDWLFVSRVFAWHDGIKEPLISGQFKRDNNSTIWEWMDVSPDNYQVEVLRSLARAHEAILRFEGDQYHKDATLSAGDKKAIREVLEAYDAMQSEM